MISQKAVGIRIKLGSVEIDGYMLPDGSYRLSKGQCCDIVGLNRKRLSQLQEKNSLKDIIGAGSSLSQKELSKYSVVGQNPKVDLIPVEMALIIWTEIGSDTSKALVVAAATESIERRLDAVVGKVRTEQEYNDRLEFRCGHLKQFHPLYTSWLKQDGVTTTYGTKVNELKAKANLPLVSIDLYDSTQMNYSPPQAEIIYDAMRRSGRSHADAMELV